MPSNEGNVLGKINEMKTILADIPDDEGMASCKMTCGAEVWNMDALEMDDVMMDIHPEYQMIPYDANKEFSENKPVSSTNTIHTIEDALVDQLFSE
eukprot:13138004-Ditylum_brightwellii.AAC.1